MVCSDEHTYTQKHMYILAQTYITYGDRGTTYIYSRILVHFKKNNRLMRTW